MYDRIFFLVAVVHIVLIACIVKQIFKNQILRWSAFALLYFSANTLSGLFGFYIGRGSTDRWYLLIGQVVYAVAELILLLKKKSNSHNDDENFDKTQIKIWAVCFMGLFTLLLFSTGTDFMPAWGNVDDAVHFEMCAQFRNIIDGGSDPLYQNLGDIRVGIDRYSYIWGFHYNCAVISKILHCDVLHIMHFMKCFSLTAFVTVPMLWIQTFKKNIVWIQICYAGIMFLFAGNWYMFFHKGFSAQLFSLAVCNVIVLFTRCKTKDNDVVHYVIIPVFTLLCLLSYILTGAFLLMLMCLYYLAGQRVKNTFGLLLACLYMIPVPPIWNQIKVFLFRNGIADEALTAGSSLKSPPSVVWVFISIILFLNLLAMWIKGIRKNMVWLSLESIELLTFIGLYFFYDNDGYIIYKVMISVFPILILSVCFFSIDLLNRFTGSIMILVVMAVLVCTDMAQLSVDSIKRIYKTEPFITLDEYRCLQKINSINTAYDGIEYIGMNGPSASLGSVLLRKQPFSAYESGNSWKFRSNFCIRDTFKSVIERSLQGGKSGYKIYVLINEENAEDLKMMENFQDFLKENTEIFRTGSCSVRKFVFCDMDFDRINYSEFIQNAAYMEADVPAYGTVALVKELQKKNRFYYKLSAVKEVFFISVAGRSIHESNFILRLYNNDNLVYEKDLSGFEKNCFINFDNSVRCDMCEIETEGKNFSDSVIIKNIDFASKND